MKIHVMTFGYRSTDTFVEDFRAADAPNLTWHLFLHSQRPGVVATCERLAQQPNVVYYPYGTNRGMARSLNVGIAAALDADADVIMMMTDDILVGQGDLQRLAEAQLDNPRCAWVDGDCFVEAVGYRAPSQLDCSTLNIRAIELIGYFDRWFFPINFEDTDWKRRAALAGFDHLTLSDTQIVHRQINKQLATDAEQAERWNGFVRTRAYYEEKWGGDQFDEQFDMPFDDPSLGLCILREMVENPYPGRGRDDVNIPA